MTAAGYTLTTAAEADLRPIIRYTRRRWGDTQARRYAGQLEAGIMGLSAGRDSFSDMSDLYPGLRVAHCQHHYVFCLPRDGAPALIVAIFHERMDLMTRLLERLNRTTG